MCEVGIGLPLRCFVGGGSRRSCDDRWYAGLFDLSMVKLNFLLSPFLPLTETFIGLIIRAGGYG